MTATAGVGSTACVWVVTQGVYKWNELNCSDMQRSAVNANHPLILSISVQFSSAFSCRCSLWSVFAAVAIAKRSSSDQYTSYDSGWSRQQYTTRLIVALVDAILHKCLHDTALQLFSMWCRVRKNCIAYRNSRQNLYAIHDEAGVTVRSIIVLRTHH